MAVPKQKRSKRRTGQQQAANMKITPQTLTKCSQCGESKRQHVVCHVCGYYGGKKVLEIESKLDKKLKKEQKAKAKEEKKED